MSRRLPRDLDYICLRCGCLCDPPWADKPLKHRGGGPGMRSCGKEPRPVLRADLEAEAAAIVQMVRARRAPGHPDQ